MALRFHESLGRLVAEVEAAGIPLDDATVFLRDGEGRLMVARESLSDAQALGAGLRKTLGAYASMRPVIDGRMAAALVKDQAASEIPVVLPGRPAEGPRFIRMVDRRFVGADWMVPPEPVPQDGPPRLVFSSLKGGVGRSTALAVLAADLARHGLKALAIDLDLEAPGIGFMLLDASEDPAQDRRPNSSCALTNLKIPPSSNFLTARRSGVRPCGYCGVPPTYMPCCTLNCCDPPYQPRRFGRFVRVSELSPDRTICPDYLRTWLPAKISSGGCLK